MKRALYLLYAVLEKEEAKKHVAPLKEAMCWFVSEKKTAHHHNDWNPERKPYQTMIFLAMDIGEFCSICGCMNLTPHDPDQHKYECDLNKLLKLCPFCVEEAKDEKVKGEKAKGEKADGKKVESRCQHGIKGGIFGQYRSLALLKFELSQQDAKLLLQSLQQLDDPKDYLVVPLPRADAPLVQLSLLHAISRSIGGKTGSGCTLT